MNKILPSDYIKGFTALLITNTIWAAAGPVIKLTVEFIPPFTFLFLRFLIVCIVLLPYLIVELPKHKISTKDYWKIAILGIFAQSSIVLIVYGLKYTTAIDATIIGTVGTLLSMAAGHYFFNESMHKGVKVGLMFALVGTLLVIIEPILEGYGTHDSPVMLRVWGNLLVFTYNLSFLLYIIWSKISFGQSTSILQKTLTFIHIKPMTTVYPSNLLAALTFYVGLLSMLPFALFESLGTFGEYKFDLILVNGEALVGLFYMALLSSICAYLLFEWALTKVSVSDTALLGYLSALLGMPFAYIILGEVPTLYNLIGAVIMAIGVIISEISAHHIRKSKTHVI